MNKLFLYSTEVCHLCEEAEALLNQIALPAKLQIEKRDIIDKDEWLEKYRISIPVLALNGKELYWPFNKIQIEQFLEEE